VATVAARKANEAMVVSVVGYGKSLGLVVVWSQAVRFVLMQESGFSLREGFCTFNLLKPTGNYMCQLL
jgi:hypothetical protein